MDSPLLTKPGAVPAEGIDTGVAAHYGDPYAEQRALARDAGQVDRSNRGILRITGEDRLSWLHSLTTQDVEHLAPGQATEALVLSPQGHIEHHLTLADDGTALWAHVEPGTADALLAFLQSMRFLLRVDPADVTGDFAVLTLAGPATPSEPPEGTVVSMELAYGTDVVVARDRLREISASLERSGVRLAGLAAHEALRIAAHRPRLGFDTDHKTLPHEVGWIETAVHLNKGCYRGQETVARVHNLGHPPRRLVFLHLDGSEDRLPSHGDPVTADGATVGFTGSVARHFELGPIALGLVKRTLPVDAPLRAGGVPAAQEIVVPPDAGANVTITLKRRSIDPDATAPRSVGSDATAPRSVGSDATAPRSVGSDPAAPRSVGSDPAAPRSVGSDPAAPPSVGSDPAAPPSVGSDPAAPPKALAPPRT